jgi:hypothetical protein
MLDERKENRRLRLIQLMAERFAGKQALLSDHVGVSPNLVSRYVRGVKGIGEDMRDKERTKPPKRAAFFGYSEEVVEQRKRASSCSRPVTALRVIQGLQCWQSVSWITRATSSCHLRRTCSSARQPFNWGRKCRPAFTVATVEHEVLLVAGGVYPSFWRGPWSGLPGCAPEQIIVAASPSLRAAFPSTPPLRCWPRTLTRSGLRAISRRLLRLTTAPQVLSAFGGFARHRLGPSSPSGCAS